MFSERLASSCPGLAERIQRASCVISTASGERSTPYRFSRRMKVGTCRASFSASASPDVLQVADDFPVAVLPERRKPGTGRPRCRRPDRRSCRFRRIAEAAAPIGRVVGRDAARGLLLRNAELDGRRREALGDQLLDRVLDDPAGEFRRGVVDAQPLAFGRLRHRGVSLGLFRVAEDARRPSVFQSP